MAKARRVRKPSEAGLRPERLISLFLLMAGGRLHTAPELSKRFDVSTRTLYRDLELLSSWGLPIEAIPGREGGFRVLPGYAIDRAILGEEELAAAAAALDGIETAVGGGPAVAGAGAKLEALLGRYKTRRRSWIRIALAPGGDERPLIELLRLAIEERRLVRFRYRDAEGRGSERRVEPVAVVYNWQSWYLWAYCRLREGWRLFKLARVEAAKSLLERFEPRAEPSEDAWRAQWESETEERLTIRITPAAIERVGESLGRGVGKIDEDGSRVVELYMPRSEWLFSFLLGFGDDIEVLEPPGIRQELANRLDRGAKLYKKQGLSQNHDMV